MELGPLLKGLSLGGLPLAVTGPPGLVNWLAAETAAKTREANGSILKPFVFVDFLKGGWIPFWCVATEKLEGAHRVWPFCHSLVIPCAA